MCSNTGREGGGSCCLCWFSLNNVLHFLFEKQITRPLHVVVQTVPVASIIYYTAVVNARSVKKSDIFISHGEREKVTFNFSSPFHECGRGLDDGRHEAAERWSPYSGARAGDLPGS